MPQHTFITEVYIEFFGFLGFCPDVQYELCTQVWYEYFLKQLYIELSLMPFIRN